MVLEKGLDILMAVPPLKSILQEGLGTENTKFKLLYECPAVRRLNRNEVVLHLQEREASSVLVCETYHACNSTYCKPLQ